MSLIDLFNAADPDGSMRKSIQAIGKQDNMLCATALLNEKLSDKKQQDPICPKNMRNQLLSGLVKSYRQIICLYLIDADGTYYEPHLTFNPYLLGNKSYTDEEKRIKLESAKIRVTLDSTRPGGAISKRAGTIGNMTVDGIIAASSGGLERSINTFFPGARFDPPFIEQFVRGLDRM